MPKAEKRPSPKNWVKSRPPRTRGIPCWLCINPKMARIVDEFRAMNPPQPAIEIAEYLRTYHDFPYPGFTTIERHLREHGDRQ